MNLFVLGWARSPHPVDVTAARDALGRLVAQLGFLDSERIRCWLAPNGRVGVAWVTHSPDEAGSARYVHAEPDRVALFAGRPFRWTGEHDADGRSPLDAAFYTAPPETWADTLDGRCFAAAYDARQGTLALCTDPLGAYPVYATEVGAARWVSNNAELLRALRGTTTFDPLVLASLLAGGWSLTGDPVWRGVRRLPRGLLCTYTPDGTEEEHELLPVERVASMFGRGFDAGRAARTVVAAAGGLADWPGRPSVLELSGGRDSRIVLAAALGSGLRPRAVTSGPPRSPDVRVAELLCEELGISHSRSEYDPDGLLFGAPQTAARLLGLMCAGTFSLADAGGFFGHQREGALPLWHNGQGGEIARGYYGVGDGDPEALVAALHVAFTGHRPPPRRRGLAGRLGRSRDDAARLVSPEGSELIEEALRSWVDVHLAAAIPPRDLPDAFYLLNRMANWAGAGHGWREYGKGDVVSPLWSAQLLPELLGGSPEERTGGAIPRRLLDAVSPALARLPYEEEVPAGPPASDPFLRIVDEIADAVLGQPGHPAWEVLSRKHVERLLALDPRPLDDDSREWRWKPAVWRLATVFMGLSTA